jgi:hypothetical protein
MTFSNPPASPGVFSFILQFVGDGTARAVAWPASARWGNGLTPSVGYQLNKVDTYNFMTHDGGTNWFAFVCEQGQ